VKELMSRTGRQLDLEVSTVALAHLYYDLLILKNRDIFSAARDEEGVVFKENRRLYASGCLLLATKYNDPQAEKPGNVKQLLELIAVNFEISAEEVLKNEFGIFVDLNFGLHAHPNLVNDGFERLLKDREVSAQEYLDPDPTTHVMYEQWEDDTEWIRQTQTFTNK